VSLSSITPKFYEACAERAKYVAPDWPAEKLDGISLERRWVCSTNPVVKQLSRATRPALAPALCVLLLVASSQSSTGCARRSEEDSPERTVQDFIDRMQRVHGDVQKSKAAYDLLAAQAQANLKERAQRASAAAGRVVRPEEMLAPSRFYLAFQPRSWSTTQGPGWAVVTAEGESPRERYEIRCVREDEHWKVVVELPELPPIERRTSLP
jgi:hypothetical protein